MSAPTFILENETSYNVSTPKTTAAFNVLQGDVLVAYAVTADGATTVAVSNSGLALAWTQQQHFNSASFCDVTLWTHVVSQSRAAVIVTLTATGGNTYGGDVLLFRGSDGIGASSQTSNASGAPTLNIATTRANSTIVVVVGDWAAVDGTSRAWRTNAGALTETTYFTSAGSMTAYGGYHADAGPINTYAVGLTAPGAQKYAMVAVEVKSLEPGIVAKYYRMRFRG